MVQIKPKYKSVSISIENYEYLMAIATQVSDNLGISISANSAVSVLIKFYKDNITLNNPQ